MKRHTRRLLWTGTLILLLGAALRIITMQVHGLDGDDAFSLMMASRPFGVLLDTFATTDIERHPKLYFVLLHGWTRLLGSTDFSGHLFSVVCDLLLGAALMRSTRAVFSVRAGLLAGLLWATNPLLIWIDGHVRMYALLALLAGVAWLAMLWAMERPRLWLWGAAALAAAGAGYTHILGFVALAGVALLAGLALVLRRRFGGVIAAGAAGVLYLPYALNLWSIRAAGANVSDRLPQTPLAFGRELIASLAANRPPVGSLLGGVLVAGVLVLLGLSLRQQPRTVSVAALLLLVAMFGAAGYFALQEGIFASKYVSYIAPAFLLVLAAGVSALPWRGARAGVLAGLLGIQAVGLAAQLQPAARPDFPTAAAYLETHADAGDAIFVLSNYGAPALDAYYGGGAAILAPWYGLPDRPVAELMEFVNLPEADTLWLVQYQTNAVDAEGRLDAWFYEQYPLRAEAFPAGLTIRGYDLRPTTADLPPGVQPLNLTFDGRVRLCGYELAADTLSRRDERLHPPSGWVHLTLYWEALSEWTAVQPMVRIEGEDGGVYGRPVERESDVLRRLPVSGWQPGQVVGTDFDLNLNPDMPPGRYKIVVRGVGADGGPLPIDGSGQDWYIVDWVTVTE